MKKIVIALVIMALVLPALACAQSAPAPTASKGPVPAPMPAPAPAPSMPAFGAPPIVVEQAPPPVINIPGAPASDASQDIERMIVRTGNLDLIVEDVRDTIDRITEIAGLSDGYVVSSQSWKEGERLVGMISIRIPATNFEGTLARLRGLAVEVSSESTSSRDVTEEYIDLSARLRNLQASEAQLLTLMEKAGTVEEILKVQQELARTRGEIERTTARMNYLENTSDTSLIEVHLQQSKLEVHFNASKSRVKKGEDIRFESQVAGGFTPYSYQWNFGDGATSTDRFPLHSYQSTGDYTVTLTVTDDRGNSVPETRVDYITVLPGWNAGSTAGSAWNGLTVFGQVMANVLIWLGIFSPVWLVIGGIVIWQLRRRRRKGAKT
ncbi:MAG: DUF4349 domain-containing protein [Chloroflexota bacterium]